MSAHAALLADSFVSLAAFAGILVFMSLATGRRASDPLARRVLFGMGALAAMLLFRVLYWNTSYGVFQVLTLIAAALVPLAALLLCEGLLRRHAPTWLKNFSAGGAALLSAAALLPASLADPGRLWALFAFQFITFLAIGWVVLSRDRKSLSAAENKAVERLALSFLLIVPLLITDYRAGPVQLPVRLGGIAILFLCWLGISLSRSSASHRDMMKHFAALAASAVAAAATIGMIAGLEWQGMAQAGAVALSAAMLASVYADSLRIDGDERRESLLMHLTKADTSSPADFIEGLRSHPLLAGALLLEPAQLGDFNVSLLRGAFDETPMRTAAGVQPNGAEPTDSNEQLNWLFEKYEATHVMQVAERPFTLLALAMPQVIATPGIVTELRAVQRMAMLISAREAVR